MFQLRHLQDVVLQTNLKKFEVPRKNLTPRRGQFRFSGVPGIDVAGIP